ncbi:MAG: hypothetical protein J7J82_05435 [Staphylothermus sp.]|nr:hypothetical protein [Staphylothermus sp.]
MSEDVKNKQRITTIRGLDPEIYEKFVETAKTLGLTVGELMNVAMKNTIALIEISREKGEEIGRKAGKTVSKLISTPMTLLRGFVEEVKDFDIISGVEELEISRNDLLSIEKPVIFMNMKKLVIGEDVDKALFEQKVRGIKFVEVVKVHKKLPKLLVAKKCSFVKKIVVIEDDKEEM